MPETIVKEININLQWKDANGECQQLSQKSADLKESQEWLNTRLTELIELERKDPQKHEQQKKDNNEDANEDEEESSEDAEDAEGESETIKVARIE